MARRRQTTGMPRKDRRKDETPESSSLLDRLLGNPSSRSEREDALNNLIQRSVISIVVVIAAIVISALVYETVIVPQLTVASVNGENITVGEFRERVEFETGLTLQSYTLRLNQLQQRAAAFGQEVNQLIQQDPEMQRWIQELNAPDILGNRVLDEMIEDLLIAQEFEAQGFSLDDAQVEFARQEFFGFDATQVALIGTPATATLTPTITPTPFVSPTPSATPLPTNTPTITPSPTIDPEATAEVTAEVTSVVEATEEPTIPPTPTTSQTEAYEDLATSVALFEDNLGDADINQASLEQFWERQAIRIAVQNAILGDLETTLFANARHILVDTEAEALEIVSALQSGESFSALAQARSTDTGSGQRGGELGWQAVDVYVPEFADAVQNATIGVITDPVESEFGWHIIQVIAREDRELTNQNRLQVEQSRFNRWLEDRREEVETAGNIEINENWPDFLN